ncbi:hypothetical protein A3Q56_08201 [Intoshia linei]|uniref:Uncharacterized protein n=1 Tax=Intoshia linei TaxID=1819745 RepID=A0A177AS78_9BILA|nr:hypothetical protein A3Q56_08201 [Intoshia linei]
MSGLNFVLVDRIESKLKELWNNYKNANRRINSSRFCLFKSKIKILFKFYKDDQSITFKEDLEFFKMQKKNSSGQEYTNKKKIKQMVREYSKIEYSYCLSESEDIIEEEQTKLINAQCYEKSFDTDVRCLQLQIDYNMDYYSLVFVRDEKCINLHTEYFSYAGFVRRNFIELLVKMFVSMVNMLIMEILSLTDKLLKVLLPLLLRADTVTIIITALYSFMCFESYIVAVFLSILTYLLFFYQKMARYRNFDKNKINNGGSGNKEYFGNVSDRQTIQNRVEPVRRKVTKQRESKSVDVIVSRT